MSLSRRQRRQMAKQFGYIGKNETLKEQRERIRRSQEMGKQLHLQHLQRIKNDQLEAKSQKLLDDQDATISTLGESTSNQEENSKPFEFLGLPDDVGGEGPKASGENSDNNG
jgi:hypothetical protein